MTHDEMRKLLRTIMDAFPATNPADVPLRLAAWGLAEQLAVDVHRMADALEVLAGIKKPFAGPEFKAD